MYGFTKHCVFWLFISLFLYLFYIAQSDLSLDSTRRDVSAPVGVHKFKGYPEFFQLVKKTRSDFVKADMVNYYFNRRIEPKSDGEGNADFWQAPQETMALGTGDCEDYAIAKLFTLVDAGVPAHNLALIIVTNVEWDREDILNGVEPTTAHAVAGLWMPEYNDWLLLDNRTRALYTLSQTKDNDMQYRYDGLIRLSGQVSSPKYTAFAVRLYLVAMKWGTVNVTLESDSLNSL